MEIRRSTLDTCHEAHGVVVVIDVLRAFTTAAHAFDRGAEEILLVSSVEEAFQCRERNSDFVLIGEVGGLPENDCRYARCGSSNRGRSAFRGELVCCFSDCKTDQNA